MTPAGEKQGCVHINSAIAPLGHVVSTRAHPHGTAIPRVRSQCTFGDRRGLDWSTELARIRWGRHSLGPIPMLWTSHQLPLGHGLSLPCWDLAGPFSSPAASAPLWHLWISLLGNRGCRWLDACLAASLSLSLARARSLFLSLSFLCCPSPQPQTHCSSLFHLPGPRWRLSRGPQSLRRPQRPRPRHIGNSCHVTRKTDLLRENSWPGSPTWTRRRPP